MNADTETLLKLDDDAPEKHRKKKSKKKKKKSKSSKKHTSAIKMNCFDQEQEDDGALDMFGNPDPRFATENESEGGLDDTRYKEKPIEKPPEQKPPEVVPEVRAPAPDRVSNNSMLSNMLEGDSASSAAKYDSEEEELMTVRSYEPSSGSDPANRGFLNRMRGLSNRSLDGRSGDQGANEGVFRQSSSRGSRRRSSGGHSRRRLSLTRKERASSRSTPNLKTAPPPEQPKAAVRHIDESEQSGATASDNSEREERSTETSEDTAATTPVEEKVLEVTEKLTAVKIKDEVIPMQKPAAPAPDPQPKPATTKKRRTSLGFRPSRGSRPSMQRAMSTSALMHMRQPPGTKSILKKEVSARNMKRQGSVRFDRVETREFDRTIGDNPSVSCGIPIGLDWHYNPDTDIQDLEDYEDNRAPRRLREQLALTPSAREYMLLKDWGVTFRELHQINQENDCIRQERWESATQTTQQARVEELLETTKRRVGRVMSRTSKKKQQERLWKDAQVGREPIDP